MSETELIKKAIDCVDKSGILPEIKDLQECGVSKDEALAFKASEAYQSLKMIRQKYTKNRKDGFKTFVNFYDWYKAQNQKCYYCGATQGELEKLFDDELVSSSKFNATLHIEQKIPKQGYNKDNCVLVCALCNNAKSDMINDKNFQKYFADSIQQFIKDLLSGKITNDIGANR